MPPSKRPKTQIGTKSPPPETVELRRALAAFLQRPLSEFVNDALLNKSGASITIGAVKWGAYAFFDYDGEPIYVGQTRESLGSRIGRHLTNQRTDAVAMSVLDPFEVRSIRVWPLVEYQGTKGADPAARAAVDHLNAVERTVFAELLAASAYGRMLNEKDPPDVAPCDLPRSIAGEIVSAEVLAVRRHPDTRIARRAQTIARLAAIIASRDVKGGLRRALATQADRLALLARTRFDALGGEALVEVRSPDEPTDSGSTDGGIDDGADAQD